ncbi:MAG: tRNA pseudouridine(38-40) synthase TruA [Cyanobacterium sp. T60_A2020_053]|nr:tRNA pseudouridine(38-40) synthase TruA [Cyanobacterium sp. T60_A2020_053]
MTDPANSKKQRIVLVIQYIGTNFCGWQRQVNQRTVQEEIEQAIAVKLGYHVTLHGAGRTDSGVHGSAQVAHFDACSRIPPDKWAKVLNSVLPDDVLIRASAPVTDDWHACFTALARRYRYTIYTGSIPNLFLQPFTWHYYHQPLNEKIMAEALNPLLGKHDFSAFRRAGSPRPHSFLEMQEISCERTGDLIHIEIQASGFLYGMVRLLVGLLVEVGNGTRSPQEFQEIWRDQRRDLVKYSAPAKGLCFLRVIYPHFPIPESVWYNSQPIFTFS